MGPHSKASKWVIRMQQADRLQIKLTILNLSKSSKDVCYQHHQKQFSGSLLTPSKTVSLSKLKLGRGEKAGEKTLLCQYGHPLEGLNKLSTTKGF